jgi:hypothetical protein
MEGSSINSTVRITDVSKPTILKLIADLGTACAAYHDVHVRNVNSKKIQVDGVWAFIHCKQKNVAKAKAAPIDAGDVWTWTAIDVASKLMVSWLVGCRDSEYAMAFMDAHHIAIYFMSYNFARVHQTLRVTLAMAAGLTSRLWEIEDIVRLLD